MPRFLFFFLLPIALAGCAHVAEEPKPAPLTPETVLPAEPLPKAAEEQSATRKLEQELALGIKAYENGRYRDAQQNLKNSLEGNLINDADQVTANKYLAFITCANRKRDNCKEYFRRALLINPQFELTPTEAGHPMWRSAFKEVKAETLKAKH